MNVLFALCDALVHEKRSPYRGGMGPCCQIRTPNIEALGQRSVTFTNHWINSAPRMPACRDLVAWSECGGNL
jgi:arylsulfatase A-like enzyme